MEGTATPIAGAENIIAVILNEVSDKSLRERVKIKIGLNCAYKNIKNSLQ